MSSPLMLVPQNKKSLRMDNCNLSQNEVRKFMIFQMQGSFAQPHFFLYKCTLMTGKYSFPNYFSVILG